MSFYVNFYTINKKENSTKLPGDATYSWTCNLKSPCGIINPSIEVAFTEETTDPSNLNYCYISLWGRYYWVNEWTWADGYWTASCTVDVLASYRGDIGASTLYVLRAQSQSDPDIIDTVYPAKVDAYFSHSSGTVEGWVNSPNPNSGTYVVGIVSNDNSVAGGIAYYALTGEQMASFRAYMLGDIKEWEEITDFSGDIAKAFIDPFQYVVSCLWFPFPISSVGSATPIKFGFWTSNVTGTPLTMYFAQHSVTIAFPERTEADSRRWLYCSPFATYYLRAMPFGLIPIDPISLDKQSIDCYIATDLVTGLAELQIIVDGNTIATKTANVGVQVQLSQISTDYTTLATGNGGGLISNIFDKIGGAIVGAVDALANGYSLSGIASSAQAGMASAEVSGSSGGMYAVTQGAMYTLYARYLDPVEEDIERFGRPLCKNVQISTLSGFILCGHGDIAIDGTAEESRRVREYLEGGFYYE